MENQIENSRSRILASATKIFAQKGLEGSRVDEIAESAGINKRMIYHYFGSKEDLYLEVLKSIYNKLYESGKWALYRTADPKENIMRAIRTYFYFLAANDDFVRLTSWEALNGGRYAAKVIPHYYDLIKPELGDSFKEGIDKGIISPDIDIRQVLISVQALCFLYFSRKDIIQTLWEENIMSPDMLENRVAHIIELLFSGLSSNTVGNNLG